MHSKGQVLIQEAEWIFVHLEYLIVKDVIIITEIIHYIIAGVIFQVFNNLGGCDRNELKMQHFQLLSQGSD